MNQAGAKRPRALLLDLDDTLYEYRFPEEQARAKLLRLVEVELNLGQPEVNCLWEESRMAVKERLGARASAHSRLLYLSELVHRSGRSDLLPRVRSWERTFWEEFIGKASLRTGARELILAWHARGGKTAIVTDLTLEVQLWKLESFGLLALIDVLAASEEVPEDKPAAEVFLLAMERLGVQAEDCMIMGDSPAKDGAAAHTLGIPFLHVNSQESLQKAIVELLP
ncbi:MAG: HAD-IA family hydrolase [Candidatus Eisenbacteria bacterium]|nr:HAD-IA family hydrolase [Candidatus Eisenbacteria bacterium]